MITVTRIEVIDEVSYNHMHCQQCNSKIGWKPRNSRVHTTARRAIRSGATPEPFAVTCMRCKTNYLIITDGK